MVIFLLFLAHFHDTIIGSYRHIKFLKKMRDNARNDLFFTSNFACARFAKICIKQDWNLFKIFSPPPTLTTGMSRNLVCTRDVSAARTNKTSPLLQIWSLDSSIISENLLFWHISTTWARCNGSMARLIIWVVFPPTASILFGNTTVRKGPFHYLARWSAKASVTLCFAIARLISVTALITFSSSELEFDET